MTIYAFKGAEPEIHESVFTAPGTHIIGNVRIEKEASVWFGTVLRGDMDAIRIGEQTNIQDLTVCHTDTDTPLTIGCRVTIGHGCIVHGCTIEDDCLIGMGATVMNHVVIGRGSIIAAGAVVLEKTVIPPGSLVTGAPGKIKKTIDDTAGMLEKMGSVARIYAGKGKAYQDKNQFYALPGRSS